jgi:hypothetical protein
VREQVPGHAAQPGDAERVEPRLLEEVEDAGGPGVCRPMLLVNGVHVKAVAERQPVAPGAQDPECCGVAAGEEPVGVPRVRQRARARGNRLERAVREGRGHG